MKRPNHRRRQRTVATLFAALIVVAFAFAAMPAQGSPPSGAPAEATETTAAAPAALTIAALGLTLVAYTIIVTSRRIRKMFIGNTASAAGPESGTFMTSVSQYVKTRVVTAQIMTAAYRKWRRRPYGLMSSLAGNRSGVVMNC